MKTIYGILLVVIFIAGCHKDLSHNNSDMEVTLVGTNTFPEELVGKWKDEDGVWEINFLPDGAISKATIEFGAVELEPGKTTEFPTWYEGKGVFESGKWRVEYVEPSKQLTVEIIVDHFYQDISKDAVEGERTEILIGSVVSSNILEMDWLSKFTFYAKLRDKPELIQFENQEEPIYKKTIRFEKIE